MHEFIALQQEASELRKSNQYEEALPLFRQLWEQHRDECTEWDGWGYAQTLRKLGRSADALDVCREVYQSNSDFGYIRNLYAWCIYDLEIKKDSEQIAQDESKFIRAVKAITDLVKQDTYSPYARAVLAVMKYLSDKNNPDYEAVLKWGYMLDPGQLREEPGRSIVEGKTRTFASDKEKWYSYMTKALECLEQWEDCLDVSGKALEAIEQLHHDNDIWFKRREALAKWHLGGEEEAIEDLEKVLKRKKAWFIQRDLAQFHFERSELDAALVYAADAALGRQELGYKWELFLLLYYILRAQEHMDLSQKHLLLAAKIRQENEWKFSAEFQQMLDEHGLTIEESPSARELERELRAFWKDAKFTDRESFTGQIKTILPHGKAGFVSAENGEEYYFRVQEFRGPKDQLQPGTRVCFFLEESFDRVKQRESMQAVHLLCE